VVKEGKLYCLHCQSLNCVHIGYSWALPEVYKIMNLKGKKVPKIEQPQAKLYSTLSLLCGGCGMGHIYADVVVRGAVGEALLKGVYCGYWCELHGAA
jgi:hypothetical protein